jgi:hypothetical protein
VEEVRMVDAAVVWLVLAAAGGGQFDMAAIAKWNAARVVHYQMTGTFTGDVPISPKSAYGVVEVSDTISVELDWDIRASAPVGQVKYANAPTQAGKTGPGHATNCPAPKVSPGYEYMTVTAVAPNAGNVELTGTRSYPAAAIPSEWPATCAPQQVAPSQESQKIYLAIVAPQMLVMPAGANPNLTIAADRKSFTIRTNDWAWTYTPSVVK